MTLFQQSPAIARRFYFILSIFFYFTAWGGPEPLEPILSLVKQTREILERGEKAEAWRIQQLKLETQKLADNPQRMMAFLEYAYGDGLLHLDELKKNLFLILQKLHSPHEKETALKLLKETGFETIAQQLAFIPKNKLHTAAKDILEPSDNRLSQDIHSSSTSISIPVADIADNLEGRVEQEIRSMESLFMILLERQDRFLSSSETWERRVWRVQTFLLAATGVAGVVVAQDLLPERSMQPKDIIAAAGAAWAANATLHYLLKQKSSFFEWLSQRLGRKEYADEQQAWLALSEKFPRIGTRLAAAAAQDRSDYAATRVTLSSRSALDALMKTRTTESTQQLFDLSLSYLENGHWNLAKKILTEIDSRNPQKELSELVKALLGAFEAKRRLETKIMIRQFAGATLKMLGLGIVLGMVHEGIEHLTPEWFQIWKTLPAAAFAAIGTKKFIDFFWRPHTRDKVERYAQSTRNDIYQSFRQLLKVDPTGALIARIAQNPSNFASQEIFTEAAIAALATPIVEGEIRDFTSGERTLTLFRMIRAEFASKSLGGKRVGHLVEQTFSAKKRCAQELITLSSELGQFFPRSE